MIPLENYHAGEFIKHRSGYQFFLPSPINQQWKDQTLNLLLEKAPIKLGGLNTYARLVPNIELFIQLHVTEDAMFSSRIEDAPTQVDKAHSWMKKKLIRNAEMTI